MIARAADTSAAPGRKAREVESLTEANVPLFQPQPGKRRTIYDSKMPGLALVVAPSGHRSWYLLRRIPKGDFEKIHLGAYPALRVEGARKAAWARMGAIALGENPAEEVRVQRAEREANSRTFEEWFAAYLEAPMSPKRGGGPKSESTKADYRAIVDRHLADWKDRAIGSIERADVEEKFERLSVSAPIQANRMLSVVRATFNLAKRKKGFFGDNPASNFDKNPETARERILDPDRELGDALAALESEECPIQRDAALLALYTGMRSGDVCRAEWAHFNLERRTWSIPALSKSGKPHTVELNAQALAVLRSRLKDREAAFKEMERERRACEARIAAKPGMKYKRERNRIKMIPGEAECVHRYVFPSPLRLARSKGLHLGSLRNVVDRLEETAHLDDFKPHDLRRTFGSYALGGGVPKEHVGASLGHARGSGATDVYLTAWNSAKAKAADAVGAFVKSKTGGSR